METYELMLILDVNKSEDDRRDIANEVEREVIDLGADVESNTQFDVRDFEYPIEGLNRGEYRLIEFEAERDNELQQELRERLNFREDVVRYLVTRQPQEDDVFDEEEVEKAEEMDEIRREKESSEDAEAEAEESDDAEEIDESVEDAETDETESEEGDVDESQQTEEETEVA